MSSGTNVTDDAPRELRVTDLAQSHAKEIRALTESIKLSDASKPTNQAMPFYMRRRAASHNINRLPRRIREKIKHQQPTSKAKKKIPSRFHRRRPKNLLADYERRQTRVRWLETHLWHAKRFHMVEKWRHKLPYAPTSKSQRAAHRAINSSCIIQDHSYKYCIEISGFYETVLSKLACLLPDKNLSEPVTSGISSGSCVLYAANQYPRGAICQVDIMFNGSNKSGSRGCNLWIWYHVAAHDIIWKELCVLFEGPDGQPDGQVEQFKNAESGIEVKLLRDELIRFNLCGKKTYETLCRVIHPVSTNREARGHHVWWDANYSSCEDEVTDRLEILLGGSDGVIKAVRCRDPRLCMQSIQDPNVKDLTQTWYASLDAYKANKSSTRISHKSPLWSTEVRRIVSKEMMTQQEINQKRSELMVPGMELQLGDDENCVPLIVVMYSNMADVIMPSKWAMAFWIAFTYAGARPGGLRESFLIDFEFGRLHTPDDYPDTEMCKQEENEEADQLSAKYSTYPPNKRPNYDKLAVNSPFLFDWTTLCSGPPVVLRDSTLISQIDKLVKCETSGDAQISLTSVIPRDFNLMAVSIRMINRGIPEPRAEICLPSHLDVEQLKSGSNTYGFCQSLCNQTAEREDIFVTKLASRLKPDRKTIGYVKYGRHSSGHGLGLGFITLTGLTSLVSDYKLKYHDAAKSINGLVCLIRSVSSHQYRFAILNPLTITH